MLVDLLESKPLPGLPVLHEVHRAVSSIGDELGHLEVLLAGRLGAELVARHGVGAAGGLAVRPLGRGTVLGLQTGLPRLWAVGAVQHGEVLVRCNVGKH